MRKLLIVTICILLFFTVFLGSLAGLIFNKEFYFKEHEKTRANERLDNSTLTIMTNEIIGYMEGKGAMGPLFTEREKLHMADVRTLIVQGFTIYYGMLLLLIILFVVLFLRGYFLTDVKRIFFWTGSVIVLFSILSFLLAGVFDRAFIIFHKVFFTNDLWIMDPAVDKMARFLPQQFFVDIVTRVYLESLFIAFLLIAIAAILKILRRRTE